MDSRSPLVDTRPLDWAGLVLLALFGIWSLLAILPLQLLSPVWGHQLVVNLVNNAPLLLIGVALLRLAIGLGPGEPAFRAWRLRVCRLAAPAACVFLLLIPLDLVSTWRQVTALQLQAQVRQRAIDRVQQQALQAIDQATDGASLANRLRELQGPQLSPRDLAQPLPDLKRELRASLVSSFTALRNQAGGATPATLFAMGKECLRLVLSALVLALGLSALSWNASTERSQLQAIGQALALMRRRGMTRRQELQQQRRDRQQARQLRRLRQQSARQYRTSVQRAGRLFGLLLQGWQARGFHRSSSSRGWGSGRDREFSDYIDDIRHDRERDQT